MLALLIRRTAAGAVCALVSACNTDVPLPTALPVSATLQRINDACVPAPPDSIIALPIAPPWKRVDLVQPVFSRPTAVTNPLFPISSLKRAVLVGLAEGTRFRAETTLLPGTRVLRYSGGSVRVLISQYVAFLDGRLHEVALDWYAQDDAGAVWYFGEDVFNYENGEVDNTDGTWVSCTDGPPAMIMPAVPQVGQVFRVENVWPKVFEEVEVIATNQVVPGPIGLVAGAMTVNQLHLDGSYAPKTFAPGYGEFSTGSGNDFEALAVAFPTDRAAGGVPQSLDALLDAAAVAQESAEDGDWPAARRAAGRANAAWRAYQATGAAPTLLAPLMQTAVDALVQAVQLADTPLARQRAIDAEVVALDLLVRHATVLEVDRGQLESFVRQLSLDVDAVDAAGARGTLVTMGLILDRHPSLPGGLFPALRRLIANGIAAADDGDFGALDEVVSEIEDLLENDG